MRSSKSGVWSLESGVKKVPIRRLSIVSRGGRSRFDQLCPPRPGSSTPDSRLQTPDFSSEQPFDVQLGIEDYEVVNLLADAVLLDTAGRLHTKTGLMDELGKVKRVVSRQAEVDEVLLVLDATTGQNGLTQARVFGDVVDVSGIVLTKLDGTAKGGIAVAISSELKLPIRYAGIGEKVDDLVVFDPELYVEGLFG